MPIQNIGSDIIEAYLKGVSVKQQRERIQAEAEQAKQMQQFRYEQLDQAWKIHEQKLDEQKKLHQAQIDEQAKNFELKQREFRIKTADAIQKGLIEPDPDKPGEFRDTPAGTAAKAAAEAEALKLTTTLPHRMEAVRQTEFIKSPFVAQRQEQAGRIQGELQSERLRAQAEQNALNRANQLEAARIRAQATLANKQATADEKKAAIDDLTESYRDDVYTGSRALEDLPTGETGTRLKGKLLSEGVKILTRKEIGKLEGFAPLQGFLEKTRELNQLLQTGTLAGQALNPRIKQLQDELAADLVIFGREAKAEKGVVTDKDIDRLRGAIPQILPGGVRSIRDEKARREANSRRVSQIENLIQEKFGTITGNFKPEQREAVRERWRVEKPKEKKKNGTALPEKFDLKNLPPGYELVP